MYFMYVLLSHSLDAAVPEQAQGVAASRCFCQDGLKGDHDHTCLLDCSISTLPLKPRGRQYYSEICIPHMNFLHGPSCAV